MDNSLGNTTNIKQNNENIVWTFQKYTLNYGQIWKQVNPWFNTNPTSVGEGREKKSSKMSNSMARGLRRRLETWRHDMETWFEENQMELYFLVTYGPRGPIVIIGRLEDLQLFISRAMRVSFSSSKLFEKLVKKSLMNHNLSRRTMRGCCRRQARLFLLTIMASWYLRIFPICDLSKEVMCQTDQLKFFPPGAWVTGRKLGHWSLVTDPLGDAQCWDCDWAARQCWPHAVGVWYHFPCKLLLLKSACFKHRFYILFRRQDNRLMAFHLCQLRASRYFGMFPICDSSKEVMYQKDQLHFFLPGVGVRGGEGGDCGPVPDLYRFLPSWRPGI